MAGLAAAKAEVILIDQSQMQNVENKSLLSNPNHIFIHTGNIATWNSLKSRKTQVPANELYHSLHSTIENWTKNIPVTGPQQCYSEETFESEEERPLVKITVKILLHKFNVSHLEEALKSVLKTLKIDYCDQLILSLPPTDENGYSFEDIIPPFWKKMEEFHRSGEAKIICSSDLDQEKLSKLINTAEIKPEVNQVNLTSCCHMPQDLVAYAKEVKVVLHTHGDQAVMLPDEKVEELIKSIEAENSLHWSTNWVARYAIVVKCRGVIKSKGYIASIQSEVA